MESEKLLNLVRFISRENVRLKVKIKALQDEIQILHELLEKEKNH